MDIWVISVETVAKHLSCDDDKASNLRIMKASDRIESAAMELVGRHGEDALEVANWRIELLKRVKRAGNLRDLDMALRVPTEIEKLAETR